MRTVFKIATKTDWAEACRNGAFLGSADDVCDGFIHLSGAGQLAQTAAKHFKGQSALLLIAFDADALGPKLRWEPSRGGELFPHLYAPLVCATALWTKPLPLGDDEIPMLPLDLDGC